MNDGLKALGSGATQYAYDGADARLLEAFVSPMTQEQNHASFIQIEVPEFTSLCPKTGQPDFATIAISYRPDKLCVESKSLKLYLGSFRQAGMFHEAIVEKIACDLRDFLQPHYIQVQGQFTPRGGIKFWPTSTYQKLSVAAFITHHQPESLQ